MLPKNVTMLFKIAILFSCVFPIFGNAFHSSEALGRWYKYYEMPSTWYRARAICEYGGGHLAWANNEQEAQALVDIVKAIKPSESEFFVGIHNLLTAEEAETLDGTPLSNIPHVWASEYYNIGNNVVKREGNCVTMSTITKNLHVKNCYNTLTYICIGKDNDLETGYDVHENNKSYKFHSDVSSWNQAYMICKAEGARLAVARNEREAVTLYTIWTKHSDARNETDQLLLGFHNMFYDTHWVTVTGQKLEDVYHEWRENSTNFGQCGVMFMDKTLGSADCFNVISVFICEK